MTLVIRDGAGGLSGSFGKGRIKKEASADENESSRQAQRDSKIAALKAESDEIMGTS